MSNPRFPSFNFPYTPSDDLRQFLVDYGRTGMVHVFKHGQNLECIPQKKENENMRFRLVSEKPTLPLNLPGQISGKPDTQSNHFGELWDCEQSVTDLTADHGDAAFGELAKVIGDVVAELSWDLPQHQDLHKSAKFDPALKRFQIDFCDIPFGLLTDFIQGSGKEEKMAAAGKYNGNCLAYASTATTAESDTIIVYPGGLSMNELCFSYLKTDPQNEETRLSASKGSFNLPEKICQISTRNEFDQSFIIAVRTDHQCWLFQNEEDLEKATFLGNLKCKSKPCAIAVSPYIPEEVIVAMETGSLWMWNADNSSVQVVRQSSACTSEEFEWYYSEFGPHPRQVVRGNQSNVELVDLRGGSSTGQDLMTLPSKHFFHDDKFTAIQRYHSNPYHYILATTQSLAVIDQRFQQHPVLKWCHSFEYPPKYISVLPDPTSADVLVFVGCYENHNVHCFQYCYGENWSSPVGMVDDLTAVLPPRSTSNPWKVSSYSEWPEMIDYPQKAKFYPKVTERLNQPLIGLSCIPNSGSSSLTVIQLSNTGDLFYQTLVPREIHLTEVRDEGRVQYYEDFDQDLVSSGGCGRKGLNLGKKDCEFVTQWVECLMEQTDKENEERLEKLGESCDTEDVGIIREEIFSSLDTEVQCSLCGSTHLGNASGHAIDAESGDDAFDICSFCKLTRELSGKLSETPQRQKKILTKEHLGLSYVPKPLHMFDEGIQCSEPLGKILLRNWYSDEQVPIDLTVAHENDRTETVKTWLEKGEISHSQAEVEERNETGPVEKRLKSFPNQHTTAQAPRTLNQDILSFETNHSPVKSPKTPITTGTADLSQVSQSSERNKLKSLNVGTPNSSQDPQQADFVSKQVVDNRCTPDKTTSQRSRTNLNTTPNTPRSPRNTLRSLAIPGSQSRTPTKKKIARIPGF